MPMVCRSRGWRRRQERWQYHYDLEQEEGPLGVYGRAAEPRQPVFEEPIFAGILFGSHRVSGGDERGGHYRKAGALEKSGGRILPMTRSRSLGSARLCYRLCLDGALVWR